jgi:F-type H+-transporting ATPase subunit gamma
MNLKEIKSRIKAVQKTGNITKAMQNIALSKLKQAQDMHDHAQLFFNKAQAIKHTIIRHLEESSPYIGEAKVKNKLYIMIGSDRGLAGPYHNKIFKTFDMILKEQKDYTFILPIGKKAFQYATKRSLKTIIEKPVLNRDQIMTMDFSMLSKVMMTLFEAGQFGEVYIMYNKYETITSNETVVEKLFPIVDDISKENETHIFETNADDIGLKFMPTYIQSLLLLSLANGKLSEHASRMIAMKNATDNAKEIASKLEVSYHRARQQAITEELIDVINGSNV